MHSDIIKANRGGIMSEKEISPKRKYAKDFNQVEMKKISRNIFILIY